MILRINGSDVRNGTMDQLAASGRGEVRQLCTETDLPPSGLFRWSATVDEDAPLRSLSNTTTGSRWRRACQGDVTPPIGGGIINTSTGQAAPLPPSPGPASDPTPRGRRLRQGHPQGYVIRVDGQVPDGKNDCKAGKNTVTVLVMNGGTANAESFAVRLVVDNAQGDAMEQSVSGLKAGEQRECASARSG